MHIYVCVSVCTALQMLINVSVVCVYITAHIVYTYVYIIHACLYTYIYTFIGKKMFKTFQGALTS